MERFAVLIPALNAESFIEPVIRGSLEHCRYVVVINDGSTDRTAEIAERAGALVLHHEKNRGKGAALRTGFDWAMESMFDGVVTLDADGQHLPQEIPKFIAARTETSADLIIGGRAHHFDAMLPRRRNANRFSAWTISIAAGTSPAAMTSCPVWTWMPPSAGSPSGSSRPRGRAPTSSDQAARQAVHSSVILVDWPGVNRS